MDPGGILKAWHESWVSYDYPKKKIIHSNAIEGYMTSQPKCKEQASIIPLFGYRKSGRGATDLSSGQKSSQPKSDHTVSFRNIMDENKKNSEKLKQERLKANQSVLKSYKIKN